MNHWTVSPEQERAEHEAMVEAALKADREAAMRDVFATAALGALIANGNVYYTQPERLRQAKLAYTYADAMVEARKQ